uniref:Phosphatidate cytidylyltransferase n=2 Tax=Guillardia theta TaxID=55529 RepID=A0A7S4L0G6_GUITH|mmetsp:Transcript_35072/g.109602  ORF Transcript_35072/g.109602 Transcript_35072/m.109602 type:complete len:488 (+) Transcript_35072:63-1526(+)
MKQRKTAATALKEREGKRPSSLASETETETETDIADGYMADDHPPRSKSEANLSEKGAGLLSPKTPKIDPHANFENLQALSKWFPNAYKAPQQEESPEVIAARKRQEFWTRTRWTFAMFIGFLIVIASGQIYVMALIICIKAGMFKEILALKRNKEKDKRIPWFRTLNWYFFAVTIYFIYGRILQGHIRVVHLETRLSFLVGWLSDHHAFKSFALWCIGFCTFILSLEKGTYKYQFTQFGWTHITLLMVVATASCMIKNMYDGMIWFFVPVCLVIWNDVYAYVFGRFWGKTPLIKLSPKKTWEGFIGAFITTVIFALWACMLMSTFDYMICSQEELTVQPFPDLHCKYDPVFIASVPVKIPTWLSSLTAFLPERYQLGNAMMIMPFVWHAINMAMFASLIAPFGGFFASGFKRAFRIKDFGDLIPGHGGITDRMDCQIIMSVFVTVYRATFIHSPKQLSVARILSQVDMLSEHDKKELLHRLQAALS